MQNRQINFQQNKRVGLLDEVRGVAILAMVLYHAAYDLVAIFGIDFPFLFSAPVNLIRDMFAGAFILISGIVCRYSRSNLRRGAAALLCGLGLTLATGLVMPSQIILYGILHFMGSAMILYALFHKLLDKLSPAVGVVLMLALFFVSFGVPQGTLGLFGIPFFRIPASIYEIGWLFPLGFPPSTFFSSDYFPLLPWLFLFFAGSYLGIYLRKGQAPAFVYRQHSRFLKAVGSHSLYIYLFHQPVIYGVLWVVFWLLRGR